MKNYFLLIFLLYSSISFAFVENVIVKKVLKNDDSFIGVLSNGDEWLIEKSLGCYSLNELMENETIIVQYTISLDSYNSKILIPNKKEECSVSKAEKISPPYSQNSDIPSQYLENAKKNKLYKNKTEFSKEEAIDNIATGVVQVLNSNTDTMYSDNGWKFGVGFMYSFDSKIKGDVSVKTTNSGLTSSKTSSIDDDTSKGLQISLNLIKLSTNSAGFLSSIDLKSSYQDSDDSLDISSTIFKGSYGYRSNSFYFFCGPNFSFHNASDNLGVSAGFSKLSEGTGGVGFQIGVGQIINKNLSLELEYQKIKFNYSIEFNKQTYKEKIEMDSYVNSLNLGVKLFFN